jgi:hypothetical protein
MALFGASEVRRSARGAGQRLLLALAALTVGVLALVGAPREAKAYSWMIRHGYSGCITCHADPSGGELLNPYGRAQGDLLVRMRYGGTKTAQPEPAPSTDFDDFDDFDDGPAKQAAPKPVPAPTQEIGGPSRLSGFLWGAWDPPSALWLGGSFRTLAIVQPGQDFKYFPMQLDAYGALRLGNFRLGGSIGYAKVKANSPNARRAQVTTGQGDTPNLISRTHWAGWESGAFYLRAGRLNLPFGVRLSEHTLWVRDRSYTDRESDQHHGVALAYSGEKLRAEVMGIAGNYQINPDKYRERGYSGYAEVSVAERFALGLSSLMTRADADFTTLDQAATLRQAHGAFMRWSPHPLLVVQGEADVLMRTRQDVGYVAMLQGDVQPVQGLHFMLTGELLDDGYRDRTRTGTQLLRQPGSGEPRFGGWLSTQWFFWHHLSFRVDAVVRQPIADESPLTLLGQLHAYL